MKRAAAALAMALRASRNLDKQNSQLHEKQRRVDREMRVIACLLLALFISSASFGICNGAAWFEGYDPQQPQEIKLNMQPKQPIVSPYTALPACNLLLSETEPKFVNLTIIVSTAALLYQDENFETWLSIDEQEPEKLVGILDSQGSAAGQLYKRQYTANLSGLRDGVHFIKVRVVGDYYGPGGGSYDCEGNVSFIFAYGPVPPEVEVLSPKNQVYNESSVSLVFAVYGSAVWTGYSLDGKENMTVTRNFTLTNLSNGLHNLTVYANDTYGNMGASQPVSFTVDAPEPLPIVPVSVAIVVIAAVVAGLLLIWRRSKKVSVNN